MQPYEMTIMIVCIELIAVSACVALRYAWKGIIGFVTWWGERAESATMILSLLALAHVCLLVSFLVFSAKTNDRLDKQEKTMDHNFAYIEEQLKALKK